MSLHIPVLLEEVVKSFEQVKLKAFFDGTVGAGGHAKALLEAHPEIEVYIAVDQDPNALKEALKNLKPWEKKLRLVNENFFKVEEILQDLQLSKIDGFLFDIGVSSMQLDNKERGFSFSKEAFLDMRMNPLQTLTAEMVINTFSEKELEKIFKDYGEEREAKKIAKLIVDKRKEKRISSTKELVGIIKENIRQNRKIHPATLVFQALRIYVNNELEVLEKGIKIAINHLNKKGRIAVISFHSLEDRIVKQTFKEESKKIHVNEYRKEEKQLPKLNLITKKSVTPTYKEIKINPRARSAKMRVAEKT